MFVIPECFTVSYLKKKNILQDKATDATTAWYNEVSQYTYGSGFSMGTGHFTQVTIYGSMVNN